MDQYVGNRLRFAGEKCPLCDNPGCAMVLKIPEGKLGADGQWICSRCCVREQYLAATDEARIGSPGDLKA